MSLFAGSAKFSVFPSFKGVRQSVEKEANASGRLFGSGFKKSFGTSTSGVGKAATDEILKAVRIAKNEFEKAKTAERSAQEKLTQAQRREKDIIGQIRVARQKLAEVTEKANGNIMDSRVIAAEEKLAALTRRHAEQKLAVAKAQEQVTIASEKTLAVQKILEAANTRASQSTSILAGTFSKVSETINARMSSALSGLSAKIAGSNIFQPLITKASTLGAQISPHLQAIKTTFNTLSPIGQTVGSKIATGFTTAVQNMKNGFSSVMEGLKTVATGALAGVAALGMKALSGGWSRATGIENAQAKFRALNFTVQGTKDMMNAALESVKGTQFGLQDAAGAASMMAATVRNPKEMAIALKNVGAAAVISGQDYGHLGQIWGEMSGKGQIFYEDLRQLERNGVPVFSLLSQAMGMSREEIHNLVNEGKLSFTEFNHILSKDLGKAAVDAADTTTGALMNTGAALSRMGASAIAPMLPGLKALLKHFIDLADSLTARVSPIFERIGNAFTRIAQGPVDGIISKLGELAPVGLGIAGVFGKMAQNLPLIGRFFTGLSGPVGVVIGLIISVISASSELRNALVNVAKMIGSALGGVFSGAGGIGSVFGMLTPVFKSIGDAVAKLLNAAMPLIGSFISALGGAFTQLAPIFMQMVKILSENLAPVLGILGQLFISVGGSLMSTIGSALMALMPILMQLVQAVIAAIVPLLPVIGTLLATIGNVIGALITALTPILNVVIQIVGIVISAIVPLLPLVGNLLATIGNCIAMLLNAITPLLPAIGAIITVVGNMIATVLSILMPILSMILGTIITIVTTILSMVVPVISVMIQVFSTLVAFIVGVLSATINGLLTVISTVFGAIASVTMTVWNGILTVISTVITSIVSVISKVMATINSIFVTVWSAISGVFYSAVNGVRNVVVGGFNGVIGFFQSVPSRIMGVFSGAGSWLVDAGRKIISGFVDTIKNSFGWIKSIFSRLTDLLPSWKGPAAKDRILLRKPAQLIMSGFADSLEDNFGDVRSRLAGMTAEIESAVTGTISDPSQSSGNPAVRKPGIVPGSSNTTFNLYSDDLQAMMEMISRRLVGVATPQSI